MLAISWVVIVQNLFKKSTCNCPVSMHIYIYIQYYTFFSCNVVVVFLFALCVATDPYVLSTDEHLW